MHLPSDRILVVSNVLDISDIDLPSGHTPQRFLIIDQSKMGVQSFKAQDLLGHQTPDYQNLDRISHQQPMSPGRSRYLLFGCPNDLRHNSPARGQQLGVWEIFGNILQILAL